MIADTRSPSRVDRLTQETKALRTTVAALEQRVAELIAENQARRDQPEESQRRAARQAVPFRRIGSQEISERNWKWPSRPEDHPGISRSAPMQLRIRVNVSLPLRPHHGGNVEWVEPYVEKTLPIRPSVTYLATCRDVCPHCGEVRNTR